MNLSARYHHGGLSHRERRLSENQTECPELQVRRPDTHISCLTVCPPRTSSVVVSRAKIKSVKLTLAIILCYVLSSCPFIVGQLIFQLSQDEM